MPVRPLGIGAVWNADNPATDLRLHAGFLLARAMCVRANLHDAEEAASLVEMDIAIEAIRKQIACFKEIRTTAGTVVNSGTKILRRAQSMEEEVTKPVSALTSQVAQLREVTGETAS